MRVVRGINTAIEEIRALRDYREHQAESWPDDGSPGESLGCWHDVGECKEPTDDIGRVTQQR